MNKEIVKVTDIKTFFRASLFELLEEKNLANKKIPLNYLTDLLSAFLDHGYFTEAYTTTPIIKRYEIGRSQRAGKMLELKILADFCLFRVGYFHDSFKRSIIGKKKFCSFRPSQLLFSGPKYWWTKRTFP